MVYEDSGYDPDEQFRDQDDGLFFNEEYANEGDEEGDDESEDNFNLLGEDDDESDDFDPDEEVSSMFPNDEYGDELEDYILDDDD